MREQIPLNTKTPVISIHVSGDLNIQGAENQALESRKPLDEMNFRQEGDRYILTSTSDCSMVVPRGSILEIEKVGGDAQIRGVNGKVNLRSTGGDLSIENAGPVEIQRVGGDCAVEDTEGNVSLLRAGGDVECRDIGGDLLVTSVGGDLAISDVDGKIDLRSVSGSLSIHQSGPVEIDLVSGDLDIDNVRGGLHIRRGAGDLTCNDVKGSLNFDTVGGDVSIARASFGLRGNAGGDMNLELVSPVAEDVSLNAGGDILLRVPADIDAAFRLGSGGDRISIHVGDHQHTLRAMTYQFQVGEGKRKIQLNAGGDITISSGVEFTAPVSTTQPDLSGMASMGDEIQRTVDESLRSAGISTGKAEHRTRQMLQKAEERIQEAMRRMKFTGSEAPIVTPITPVTPVAPIPPVPLAETQPDVAAAAEEPARQEPVSDEERLLILRMVQEKKITIEQAEQLLEALDVQDFEAGL